MTTAGSSYAKQLCRSKPPSLFNSYIDILLYISMKSSCFTYIYNSRIKKVMTMTQTKDDFVICLFTF